MEQPENPVLPITIKRIAIVAIHASDLAESLEFYKGMLGFVEAEEQMLSPGVTLTAGEASIYLADGRTRAEREPEVHPEIVLCLVAPGMRSCYERLRDAGVRIIGEYDQPNDFFASLRIADPDGNTIELMGAP